LYHPNSVPSSCTGGNQQATQQFLSAAGAAQTVVTAAVAASVLGLILARGLGLLWALLDVMQMIYYYAYINAILPINFQKFLLLFKIYLIPLPNITTDMLSPLALSFNFAIPDEKAPPNFDQQGISAFFLVNGGGSILAYLLFSLIATYLTTGLNKILKRFTRNEIIKFVYNTFKNMKWSFTIRFLMTNSFQLSCAVFLQLTNFETSDALSIVGHVLNLVALSLVVLFPVWAILKIRKRGNQYTKEKFDKRFGSLSDDIKEDGDNICKVFPAIICVKKMCFIINIALLYNYVNLGLLFLSIQSMLVGLLTYRKQPYERKSFNIGLILQEAILLALDLIILSVSNGYISSQNYDLAGWVAISLCLVLILYYLVLIMHDQIIWFIQSCKFLQQLTMRKLRKRRLKVKRNWKERGQES